MDYKNKKFKVAFTYRNIKENTEYVDIIYNGLIENGIDKNDIFLDKKMPHLLELNSEHLPTILPLIYQNSNVVVVCLAEGYEESKWCGLEFKSVLDIILDRINETFIIKLDNSKLPSQLKNTNYLKKEIVEDIYVIKEIIRRSTNKSSKSNNPKENNIPTCKYELRENDYYETISGKIKKYYRIEDYETPIFIEREHLLNKIKNKIHDLGIVFIEGSLLTGKTILLNHFSKWIKSKDHNIILKRISGERMIYQTEPTDNVDLYQIWGKSILEHLFDTGFLKKSDLKDIYWSLFHDPEIFKSFLRDGLKGAHSNINHFHIFLQLIEKFIKEYGKGGDVLCLAIHLDDFQKYVNPEAYDKFEEDLESIQASFTCKELEYLKLIISTRLFHKRRPYDIVVNIDNYSTEETRYYLNKYIESIDDNCINELINLIHDYTSGHPWFVNRFINIYLILRVSDRESNPLQLSRKIFETSIYWLRNKIFDLNKPSLFRTRLHEIVNPKDADECIINFLEEENFDYDRFVQYKGNPILKETGLIQISLDEEQEENIEGYGNKIMQLFFHTEMLKCVFLRFRTPNPALTGHSVLT